MKQSSSIWLYCRSNVNGTTGELDGDWTGADVHIGYRFSTDVTIPQFYVTKEITSGSFRADSRSSLIIHRLFVETGSIGVIEFTLERLGKPDYTELLEATMMNTYNANAAIIQPYARTYLPAYERNTAFTLRMLEPHTFQLILYYLGR